MYIFKFSVVSIDIIRNLAPQASGIEPTREIQGSTTSRLHWDPVLVLLACGGLEIQLLRPSVFSRSFQ